MTSSTTLVCTFPLVARWSHLKIVFVKLLFLSRNQAWECCVSINVSFFETLENIRFKDNHGTTLFYDIKDDKENINRLDHLAWQPRGWNVHQPSVSWAQPRWTQSLAILRKSFSIYLSSWWNIIKLNFAHRFDNIGNGNFCTTALSVIEWFVSWQSVKI